MNSYDTQQNCLFLFDLLFFQLRSLKMLINMKLCYKCFAHSAAVKLTVFSCQHFENIPSECVQRFGQTSLDISFQFSSSRSKVRFLVRPFKKLFN